MHTRTQVIFLGTQEENVKMVPIGPDHGSHSGITYCRHPGTPMPEITDEFFKEFDEFSMRFDEFDVVRNLMSLV